MEKQTKTVMAAIAAGLVLVCLAAACRHVPTEEGAFRQIERSRDAAAFERFAASYPNSPHVAEARQRAAALREENALRLFESARKATKASLLERFMLDHPYPRVVLMCKLRIAEIDFDDIVTNNPFRPARAGNASLQDFVSYYAFTDEIPIPQDAEQRKLYYESLHRLIVQALASVGSAELWLRYLATYSDTPYFTQGAGQLERLLLAQSNKWEGYDLLRAYFALWEQKLKRPCPNRATLVRSFQEGLATVVERENTLAQYRRYLDVFPDSVVRDRIVFRIDHLELVEACVRGERTKMKEVIQKYGNRKEPEILADVRMAGSQLEQLEYKDALIEGTPAALRDFIARYQKDDHAGLLPDANARLKKMHDQLKIKAKATNTSATYRQFLKAFPDSSEKGEVEQWLEEAEFKEAFARNNRESLEAFRKLYPNSRYRQSVDDQIENLDFKQEKTAALGQLTTDPLKRFLSNHPKGKHADEARDLISKITEHHSQYVAALGKARQAGNPSLFSTWLIEQSSNYFAAQRGQKDLDALKRTVTVQQLVSDLTTSPSASARSVFPLAVARALSEYKRVIASIETNVGAGSGFLFSQPGLLLTNGYLLRNAELNSIAVKMAGKSQTGKAVHLAEPGAPDFAVVRVTGEHEPIPLGNSSLLSANEEVYILSAQTEKGESPKGTVVSTRTVGPNEWLVIRVPKGLALTGGVVLNQRARAIALLVRAEDVDASVKEKAPDLLYALSLRSAKAVMEKVISEQ